MSFETTISSHSFAPHELSPAEKQVVIVATAGNTLINFAGPAEVFID
jgi:hypothetical protein